MKKIGLILLAGFALLAAPIPLAAQADDPSEVFLKAYMTSQQGDKLEHDNQFQAALVKFRSAGSLLEELRKTHAEWQPAIVEYRARKIGESILRVQTKIGTQADFAATSQPAPVEPPLLPQNAGPAEPSVEIGPNSQARLPVPTQTIAPVAPAPVAAASVPSDAAIKKATKELQDKVDQLQAELQKSRTQYSSVQKEKETLTSRLQETNSKLEKAQAEVQKSKGAEKIVRDQLAQAQESLKKIQANGGSDGKATEALRAEIAQLKKAVATAEQGRTAAEKEKEAATAKLDEAGSEIASVTKERDQLIAEIKDAKGAQERVQTLVAENSDLQKKLAEAEKTVREITDDKPQKEQEIADVKRQVEQLRQQLAASQKQKPRVRSHDRRIAHPTRRNERRAGESETHWSQCRGDGAPNERKRNAARDCDAGTAGRCAPRGGEETDAGRVREIADQIGHAQRADRTARAAGGEIERRRTGAFEAAGGGHIRQQSGGRDREFCGREGGCRLRATSGPNVETSFKPGVPDELIPHRPRSEGEF